jgi:ribosomal protein S25
MVGDNLSKKEKQKNKREIKTTKKGSINISDETAVMNELKKMGAVTPYSTASKFDIKISESKLLLKKLFDKGLLELVGGNTRIRIYSIKK